MREPQGDVKIQPNPRTHLGLCLDVFVRLLHVIENIFTLLLVYLDVHFVGKMYIYVMYVHMFISDLSTCPISVRKLVIRK